MLVFGLAALTAGIAGCAGGSDADSSGGSANAFSSAPTTCSPAQTPNSFEDLQALDSCQLKSLFESEFAKQMTMSAPLPNGPYDGIPLCRKDIIPTGSGLPAGVRAISGAPLIIDIFKLSNSLDNTFASALWHGKEFTAGPGAQQGSVLNFIDLDSKGINADTHKSAEAVHFHDLQNEWMVLDYSKAVTGLQGALAGISVEIISHVYDTVRLVNPDQSIYLGMAWLVDKPGVYQANNPAAAVQSCYFALRPH
jgi:hypothetical protein